jgi:hypothetical protein
LLWFEDHPRSLAIFFAEGRAFVLALREPGDVGEVATDPNAAGDETPFAFNGQVGSWPAATVSHQQAERVLEAWARGSRFDGVDWTTSPPGIP